MLTPKRYLFPAYYNQLEAKGKDVDLMIWTEELYEKHKCLILAKILTLFDPNYFSDQGGIQACIGMLAR